MPLVTLVLLTIGTASGLFGKLPTFEELENPKTYLASEVYSSDGQLIGKYYIQNRSNIQYKDISPYVINGLVATEDARFFEHWGLISEAFSEFFSKQLLGEEAPLAAEAPLHNNLPKCFSPGKKTCQNFTL